MDEKGQKGGIMDSLVVYLYIEQSWICRKQKIQIANYLTELQVLFCRIKIKLINYKKMEDVPMGDASMGMQ